jgi:hypothetical protein
MRQMSCEGPGALCSNLQKACSKQHRSEEASLSGTLDSYQGIHHATKKEQDYQPLIAAINADFSDGYAEAGNAAEKTDDRG